MDWEEHVARECGRYADGSARPGPEQLVRLGNAAYGAGLSLLMLGRREEAVEWLDRAGSRWRESWEHAAGTAWGRPVGAIKAALLARGDESAVDYARWALELGCAEAESPIGRYAGTLALVVLRRFPEAELLAATLCGRDDFPAPVAGALTAIALADGHALTVQLEAVLVSFEERDDYLEGVPVADTVLALLACARRRGTAVALRRSAVLPRL